MALVMFMYLFLVPIGPSVPPHCHELNLSAAGHPVLNSVRKIDLYELPVEYFK